LQLGFPEESLAWLKPVLGKWITVNEDGIGTLAPEFYYALVTMHGTIHRILRVDCRTEWYF
jgi:cytochrome c oxidase subunit 1